MKTVIWPSRTDLPAEVIYDGDVTVQEDTGYLFVKNSTGTALIAVWAPGSWARVEWQDES